MVVFGTGSFGLGGLDDQTSEAQSDMAVTYRARKKWTSVIGEEPLKSYAQVSDSAVR